ncbi:N-acetylneuraminate synthase [uncultured Desulfosarcina sp.]|uniref:N-acetylneuraminate synthase n=1 Tax=uncultured Desulfosarcina sp. TaxID=218289 RepID=UPI0029C9718F|nr:N-acetylneuraminate synthase [uncultured Desulfosarcina sp.]
MAIENYQHSEKVFIIAEAGVNHNGSFSMGFQLIDAAMDAGADAIKFQTFKAERLVTRDARKAEYQRSCSENESQFDMLRQLELKESDQFKLLEHCRAKGFQFLSSPFDLKAIDFLNKLGITTFKIPSGEINNLPYLRKIGSFNKEIILSTGMSTLAEIEEAIDILNTAGTPKNKITVLHCNSAYPSPIEDVNLRAMLSIRNAFNVKIGYSDHTIGIEISIAAVAMGAKIIEKHFTLNNDLPGPDHKVSLNPHAFKKMVTSIRNVERALGSAHKKPTPSELKNKPLVRKSIVASKEIKKGEVFTEDNLTVKRPSGGVSPLLWDTIIGKIARKDYKIDQQI